MFQVLKSFAKLIFSPEDINLGDRQVQKIGDSIESVKGYFDENRSQREQLEWDAEMQRISQHSREVRAKWLK